jgi:NAD(P)-dependent dehydrogenase (short-subunit alcohol dehydrogenase family)
MTALPARPASAAPPSLPALFDLSGRVAVVTGGGGALGRVTAVGLAAAGASVAVVDLHRDAADSAAAAISETGGSSAGLAGDLGREEDVERVFDAIDERFGRVDVLVNAVSAPVGRFDAETFPVTDWNHMLAANLTSYFLTSRAAATRMIRAKQGGSIVNFSSIAGATALGRGNLAYAVAKGGVQQLTRETSYAWAPHGIRVNSILPCQFTNAWWRSTLEDPERRPLVDRVTSAIPLGRLGEPAEIVGPVLFLASDASSMVTGVSLPVDGGNLAMNAGASLTW